MSKFDKNLKVGDLITAYHKGFHIVTNVEKRFFTKKFESTGYGKEGDEYSSLIHYKSVLTSNFKPANRQYCCDAHYCIKLTPENVKNMRESHIEKLNRGYDELEELVNDT